MSLSYILFTSLSPLLAESFKVYHIGNSLTWDSSPPMVAQGLIHAGYEVGQGYHIACGQSLTAIERNPGYTCVTPPTPYGCWTNALANHEWNAITLQAYPGATVAEEISATRKIIEVALSGSRNQSCKFYLLLAWPKQSDQTPFSELLQLPCQEDSAPVALSAAFLDRWFRGVVDIFPALDIRAIPTGLVFWQLDEKLKEIALGQHTNTYSLYRDEFHMGPAGQHVATSAILGALSGKRPEEQTFPSWYTGYIRSAAGEVMDLAHEVTWHTLTRDPRVKLSLIPEITMRYNRHGRVPECVFLGKLYFSHDLEHWSEIVAATSPYRIHSMEKVGFYRAQLE